MVHLNCEKEAEAKTAEKVETAEEAEAELKVARFRTSGILITVSNVPKTSPLLSSLA